MEETIIPKTKTLQQNRRDLVAKLIENMNGGYVPLQKRWASARPYNPVSKCYYKAGNFLRLKLAAAEAGYEDNRWCTYIQAQKQGWGVKRGEKGTLLEKWIFSEERWKEDPETGKKIIETVPLEKPKCNYFYVFNAEQMYGIPEKETNMKIEPGSEKYLEMADNFIASSECSVYEDTDDRAFYRVSEDAIHLPHRTQFKDPESFSATLLHEMAHSSGAENRLGRDLSGEFGSESYAKEELRAEIASAMLSADVGLPPSAELLQDNSNYLLSWIEVLNNDPNELFRAARDAEKASDYILKNYNHYLDQHKENEQSQDQPLEKSQEEAPEERASPHQLRRYNEAGELLCNDKPTQKITKLDSVRFLVENEIALSGSLSKSFIANLNRNGYDYQNGEIVEIPSKENARFSEGKEPAKDDDMCRICRELKKIGCEPNKRLAKDIEKLEHHTGKKFTASDLNNLSPGIFKTQEDKKLALVINNQIQGLILTQ